jgi:Protein of unknown function (DUF3306)
VSNDRDNEPFLSRWARQKRETKRERQTAEPSAAEAPDVDLTKLPNVDELTADSDITGFLQKGVPEALQKLALRRMWALDPAIRDFVEMAENQWDFNAPGGIPGLYQDIAEGADVSVWLAQASQSVVGEARDQQTPDAPNVEHVATQRDPDPRNSQVEAISSVVAESPSSTLHNPEVGSQPSEIAQKTANVGPIEQAGTGLSRRRHGGALPI